MSKSPTKFGYAGPTSPLKPLRDEMARYSQTGGGIAAMGIARTARPEIVGLDSCPYAERNLSAARIEEHLHAFGMPQHIKGDHLLNFENPQSQMSGWQRFKKLFSGREHVIFESRDEHGRLHADAGPAAVTNRGTLIFMKEGRLAPGKDGFAAIRVDGSGYRSVDKATELFGELVGVRAPADQTRQASRTHRDAHAELEA
ncbi:hypothetical protein CKO28_01205 [Rhodovibrio sodomensis]|uniref:Uncharacterized protein n=1 Tax=Rhodovibrio sodomensis TaxID=1088 RepID=A0ABS1D8C5_9PROT|nr:hypothetical protein [Rhodovibrio sodomensis]MBK1666661.1 hypothetical protein [Rhodovibrio sodomensis]